MERLNFEKKQNELLLMQVDYQSQREPTAMETDATDMAADRLPRNELERKQYLALIKKLDHFEFSALSLIPFLSLI